MPKTEPNQLLLIGSDFFFMKIQSNPARYTPNDNYFRLWRKIDGIDGDFKRIQDDSQAIELALI